MSTSTTSTATALTPTVRPLTTRDTDALTQAAVRAAEGLGVRGSVTVLDAGVICSASGGMTQLC